MGEKPSGPWRRVDDGEAPSLGPYEDAPWLWKYATLYDAVARRSNGAIGPGTVDGWESWQVAAFLGVGIPTPDGAMPGASGRDVMTEHVAYLEAVAQGQDPDAPVPDAPDRATAETLMASFLPGGGPPA